MSLPTMTFSLRPYRSSIRPETAASVRTLVVSWNEAAETNDSVARAALVMPRSTGANRAGCPPSFSMRSFSSSTRHLLLEQELGVARVGDLHEAAHLADDGLDVLVVDGDALGAVDLLDLVHQVALQLGLAQHRQDIVRVDRTVGERLSGRDPLAVLDDQVGDLRDRVLPGRPLLAFHVHLPGAAAGLANVHGAGDLADHSRVLRAPRLEELDHARQAAGDVLGLGGLARDLGEHIAGVDGVALGDHQVGTDRQLVPALGRRLLVGRADHDRRDPPVGADRLDDDLVRVTGQLVDLLAHVLAFDQVHVIDLAGHGGEHRGRERVPLGEDRPGLDELPLLDRQDGAVHEVVALALAAAVVRDRDLGVAGHDDGLALGVRHRLDPEQLDRARAARLVARLLGGAGRRAAVVERPHRELGARLADRLRRDDAHRLAELRQAPGGEHAPVALAAGATARLAGQQRPDLDPFVPG